MRHLDLFSGIGGFALAASWVWGDDYKTVCFVEYDPESKKPSGEQFNQLVLKKNFPGVPVYGDIKKFDAKKYKGTIDLLTGGFPCQPFSIAGKQRGAADYRFLWPEMFRIIQETQTRWVIAENVPGIINMELDQVLSDLENEGYAWETFIIPACAVDAPHRRDRVWILAHSQQFRRRGRNNGNAGRHSGKIQIKGSCSINPGLYPGAISQQQKAGISINNATDSQKPGFSNGKQTGSPPRPDEENGEMAFPGFKRCGGARWPVEPELGRVANGISNRVDRIRGLGNAIVPQVAAILLQIIKDLDK